MDFCKEIAKACGAFYEVLQFSLVQLPHPSGKLVNRRVSHGPTCSKFVDLLVLEHGE
jgi:hypothetical protein